MKEFQGKTAVITGAASGIGRAICDECVARGMNIVAADVQEEALAALGSELSAAGVRHLLVTVDVREPVAMQALADSAFDTFGAVHLLFNNAGVALGGRVWEHSIADFDWVFGVNVMGVIHGLRSFMPRLLAQQEASHVVNTASMAGLTSAPGMGAYYASKHAVIALSETLYLETTGSGVENVGVSVLCPEVVRTQIGASQRNRPQELAETGLATDEKAFYESMLSKITEHTKITPDTLAKRTFDAIEAERFYILPPEGTAFRRALNTRLDSVRDANAPEIVVPYDDEDMGEFEF